MPIKIITAFFLIYISGLCLWAEEDSQKQSDEKAQEEKGTVQVRVPVFPRENKSLVFIEGEEAVSTNFNKEPILNYSCSRSRTLQLNRSSELQSGTVFYAEFVAYLEEPGTYELWYGGTPPGPHDELLPSYSSPFAYVVDDGEITAVYREDMVVVEEYAPSYYWNLVDELELEAGQHSFRFTVSEKRRYDGRYYFYLDCFFLIKKEEGKRVVVEPLPQVFPKDMANRSRDYPFQAIEDYLISIREEPDKIELYMELSSVYTLLSDYLNALKYLKRALLIDPDNPDILLLIAKNLIWKGDVSEGLEKYKDLLVKDPQRLEIWMEAGKVAAWTGRYEESISFFLDGLEKFPENLALAINLGLTYLWAGRKEEAEEYFTRTRKKAGADYELLKELADVFYVNGYPDRAIAVYQEAVRRFPDRLEPYLLLEEIHLNSGDKKNAEAIRSNIEDTFLSSERLTRYLKIFHVKQGLKENIIEEYRNRLAKQPDNLELRETLAQTYFWNGLRKEAIAEYQNILVNHAFISLKNLDQDALNLLEIIDRSYLYSSYFNRIPEEVKKSRESLTKQLTAYRSAEKGEAPQYNLAGEEKKLALALAETRLFVKRARLNLSALPNEWGLLEEINNQEKQEEELFLRMTQSNRWKWDKRVFVQELQSVEGKGLVLAKFVLGKVYLIDQNFSPSERLLKGAVESGIALPEYQYGQMQSLLWQEKIEGALDILDRSELSLSSIVPYVEELKELSLSLYLVDRPGQTVLAGEPEQELAGLIEELENIEKEALIQVKEIKKKQDLLHDLLQSKIIRSIYHLQENTYLLRNELGDYYLKEEDLEAAIIQFKQVLAIDPWDISAVYRLGKVYEWSGDWKQAMENYQQVYYADPQYENTAALYNQLSRQHADSLDFTASYLADTSRLQFLVKAAYLTHINTAVGLSFEYQADSMRLYTPGGDPFDAANSSYLIHDLATGLPLYLRSLGLTVTPTLGLYILNELYSDTKVTTGLPPTVSALDFFGFSALEFHGQLNFSIGLGPYISANGAYRFGRQKETFAPGRTAIYAHSGELELSTSLSFIKAEPFKSTSLRTYGGVDFLTDGNIMFTGVQDIVMRILKLKEADFTLSLLGNFQFQNCSQEEQIYYTPMGVLVLGGGLAASSWINMGEESGLGFYLRGSAASFLEKIFTSMIERVQVEVEGNINFSKGETVYTLGALFTTTYKYSPPAPANPWDYWSFYISLGYSANLPKLLAP